MSLVNFINNTTLKNFYADSSVTVTASTTVLKGCVIPISANTFTNNDVFRVSIGVGLITPGDIFETRLFWNTGNTLTNAKLLAYTFADGDPGGNNTNFLHMIRSYHIINNTGSGPGTIGITTAYTLNSEIFFTVQSGTLSYNLDWTKDSYLIVGLSAPISTRTIKNSWFKLSAF